MADIDKQEETPKKQEVKKIIPLRMYAIRSLAAVLVLGVCLGLFARFYTTTVRVSAGEFASHTLPDNSIVHLNAASALSYAPYWWSMKREVTLEGEAFFEVEKGERFKVVSSLGATEVLGTKFNVYARKKDYHVYCQTGKVRVTDTKQNEAILTPGHSAELIANGLKRSKKTDEANVLAWKSNKFNYFNTPMSKVFADLEIHYNINIDFKATQVQDITHVDLSDRPENVEKVLKSLEDTYSFKFKKVSANKYILQTD